MTYQSENPNDGKVLRSFQRLTSEQFEKSLVAAKRCFQTGKPKTYAECSVSVNKAAGLFNAHAHAHVGGTRRLPCTN